MSRRGVPTSFSQCFVSRLCNSPVKVINQGTDVLTHNYLPPLLALQRFLELCENCRVLSHQILTGKTDRSETALEIINHHAGRSRCYDVYKY